MNTFTACVFPETLPDEELLFPLVQVFGTIVYLQAVEQEQLDEETLTSFIEQLLDQERLCLFAPAPLGEQRERFLALVNDMKRRGHDYMSQLSMLTLAGMHRGGQAESKTAILSNLLQHSKIDSKNNEELELWQSRLLLKLGEFYDIEQAGLEKELKGLLNRQDALLAALREDDDSPFELTTSLQSSDRKESGALQHRLKAWSRLFAHGTPPQHPHLFVTRYREPFEALHDSYEKNNTSFPRKIASFALPSVENPLAAELSLQAPLVTECPAVQTALSMLASQEAKSEQNLVELEKLFADCASEWTGALAARYPESHYGRCSLDIFLFPHISPGQLFSGRFTGRHRQQDIADPVSNAATVIGLLTQNQGNS